VDTLIRNFLFELKKNKTFYLFALPALLYLIVFIIYPFIFSVDISFQKYGLLGSTGYSGFGNYIELFDDPSFIRAIKNTLVLTVWISILSLVTSVFLSIILQQIQSKYFRNLSRTVLYIPYLLSWVVIIGLAAHFLRSDGLLTHFFANIGLLSSPVNLMTAESSARSIIIGLTIYRSLGYFMILHTAALVSINPNLYEAGDVCGASFWQKVRYITLPGMAGSIKVVLLLTVINSLRIFAQPLVMQNPSNKHMINTLILYVYENGILSFDIGLASAASVVIFLLSVLISVILKKIINY